MISNLSTYFAPGIVYELCDLLKIQRLRMATENLTRLMNYAFRFLKLISYAVPGVNRV